MTVAWRALTHWQAASCAAPPGHRVHVLASRGRMQGKIKGRDTVWREIRVCTWGWRGTRQIAAPCRMHRPCRASIGQSACIPRRSQMGLDGALP